MLPDKVIAVITEHLSGVRELDGLFLGGSHGKGEADNYSDFDFVGVAETEAHQTIKSAWRRGLKTLGEIVFWREFAGDRLLVNAITEDWCRYDLFLVARSQFTGRTQPAVRPLLDASNIHGTLPERPPAGTPDPKKVKYLIEEFIRVLGLFHVGSGRQELVTLVRGVGLLRDLLTDLMVEECPLSDRGGALHLSKLLSPEQMKILVELPCPPPDVEALARANVAVAEAFFPIARRLATELDIEWPDAFEQATRRLLKQEHGISIADI